jgi:HAD superfamily hydrolase (TIGR01490 family)
VTLAIFDIDGTLVRGSSERQFWRFLALRGHQGPAQLLAFALFLLRYLPTGGVHTLKKNKAYLAGLETGEVAALARTFVATELVGRLYEPAVARLNQHLQRGHTVVLLSGTIDPVARALAEHLGVRHVCATLCAQRRGRYLAQPPETHPFGAAKLALATQLASELGMDLRQASAYGDSARDLYLLEAVGFPVAVCPDRTLYARALEKDWEILGATQDQSLAR